MTSVSHSTTRTQQSSSPFLGAFKSDSGRRREFIKKLYLASKSTNGCHLNMAHAYGHVTQWPFLSLLGKLCVLESFEFLIYALGVISIVFICFRSDAYV